MFKKRFGVILEGFHQFVLTTDTLEQARKLAAGKFADRGEKGANKMKDMKAEKVEVNLEENIKGLMEATITENMPVALGPWADAESVPMEEVKKICNIMGRRCYARGLEHGSVTGKHLGQYIHVNLDSEEREDEGNGK